ncbi:TonB-linked outer membrane protein, SusC/RagA family [Chitinophaga sp. YR573]|uniref:SusC/RagA family TonB-linked outer membrane protein n=1 Tax=Chitinophaga sp. YR573 TaxID=1881040 RepID=UPI0008C5CF80|nr:SusC/RagA family TonB-linked outer membrane protein [Chitinophaga sp. YR573]SEW37346.1 TonB-linked outer membrane protein, SusC/RagA family [Chitinophaga sp. YR573]
MSYQFTHLKVPLIGICLLLLPYVLFAQVKLSGKVTDKKTNTPVPGVVVREKGSKQGTTTNDKGQFTLELKTANPSVLVSFVGFQSQEIKVGNKSTLDIQLQEDVKGLNDVVVIGYQDIQRRKTTGAVSSVKGKDIENIPYATFDQMLQGRVAGLSVLSVSGEPGSNGIVNVRGSNSVTLGGVSNPLYVIDGIIYNVNDMLPSNNGSYNNNPLTAINPNDIESIDVLKDASAAAIYGARGANGVILVKTKRPKSGLPQYTVNYYTGIAQKPAMKPMLVGAAERRMKMEMLYKSGYNNFANLSVFLTDSLNPAFNNNTDWQGIFLQNASINNIDASVSAANVGYSYRLSVNGYKEEGVMRGYYMKRLSPHLFLSLNPGKKINIAIDVLPSFVKVKHGTGDGTRYPFDTWNFPSSFWNVSAAQVAAYQGNYSNVLDNDNFFYLTSNVKLTDTLAKNLVFTSSFSHNYNNNRRDYYKDKSINTLNRNDAYNFNNLTARWEVENYINWSKTMGKHSVSVVLGQGAENQQNKFTYAEGNNLTVGGLQTIEGISRGNNLYAQSHLEERSRLSWFGRLNYEYKEKYLISGSYRRDASSKYSSSNRWGNFYSASAGWIVSEEPFFEPAKKVVNFLKFRGSYGVTGNDPAGYYAKYQALTTNASYYSSSLGGNVVGNMSNYNGTTVVYPDYSSPAANRNITWESYPQTDIGMDVNFMHDRISLTADWYARDGKNVYLDNVLARGTTGYSFYSGNLVDFRNTGIEITINSSNFPSSWKLQWNTNFNIAFNKNYITRLPDNNRDLVAGPPWMQQTLTVGRPMFTYKVWQVNGVYSKDSDVPTDPLTGKRLTFNGGNPYGAGDPILVDQNGDYKIDLLDKVSYGDPQAHVTGGITNTFTYKGFSMSVLCTFIKGRKLWNGYLSDKLNGSSGSIASSWGPNSGPASDFKGATFWQQEGDNAQYGSLLSNNVDKWNIANSVFVEDASFFRMKNIMLGYNFSQGLVKHLKIGGLRIYGMLDNIFVLSNATVPDPELINAAGYSSGNDYPLPKKYTLGLQVQL